MFQKREGTSQESSEDRTHQLQVVMVQLQMQGVQDVILLQTVTVNQMSRPVAMRMQMSKTEMGLMWRSVSSSEMRLQQQCDPATLSMLPAQVSVVAASAGAGTDAGGAT